MDEARERAIPAGEPPAEPIERAAAAELLGSFLVVFVGAGSIVVAGSAGTGLVGVALASGFAFAAALAATFPLSAGGVNPVLTAAFWIAGRLSSERAAIYVVAQLLGAILAAVLLRLAVPQAIWRPAALGAPRLAQDMGIGAAVVLEAVLVFLITMTAFAVLVDERASAPSTGPIVLGLLLTSAILVAWPLTGAALNPARALGPELAAGVWSDWWVYWIGPTAGAVVAAVAYWSAFLREPAEPGSTAPGP